MGHHYSRLDPTVRDTLPAGDYGDAYQRELVFSPCELLVPRHVMWGSQLEEADECYLRAARLT
ncbi:MAG: hypothetical protein AAF702_22335 [Chloroflexota bacterium]